MKENLQTIDSRIYECLDMPRNDKEFSSVLMLVNGLSVDFPVEFTDEESIKSLESWELRSFTYYFPQVKAALEMFRSFRRAYKKRERYVTVCHEATCQRYLSSPALDRWLENTKEAKINDIQIAKDRRWRSIAIKLAQLGYTEVDYETQLDEEHWKWNSLIAQTRPLTNRIWRNIRPQLEETIRLRRELRIRLEREHRFKVRQRELVRIARDFIDSEDGKMCTIVPSELLELPGAKQVLDSEEPSFDIPQVHQTTLKQQMVEMSKGRHLKFEEEGSSKVLSTRHAAGLKAFKSTTRNSLEDRPGKARNDAGGNEDILQHPTTVFKRHEYGEACLAPFSELLEDIRDHCLRKFDFYPGTANTRFQWTLCSPSHNGILYAEALYSAVALPFKTMDEMLALGESFICLRCDPINRKLMSWTCLVNHFYHEYQQFEEREAVKKSHDNYVIPNIEDHDRKKSRPLATYIGNLQAGVTSADSPEVPNSTALEKWIQPCTCESHTSDDFFYTLRHTCPECSTFGMAYCSYPCLGKLDAHRRAIHAHGQEL
ncbi:hypothetical protein DFH11DRAFT_146450 [Phellopilus nigrolimitatus]|nr:hypothetical protein DFH11DRAFT_146450 [Phellopilus nigrolimitatus]